MSIEIPQDIVEMNQEILSALKADEVDLSRKYTVDAGKTCGGTVPGWI